MRRRAVRVATLEECARYGHPGVRDRGLMPPIAGAAGWVVDQQLGTHANGSSAVTWTLTTTNAAASGSFILLGVGWFRASTTTLTISGGGLTWAQDVALRGGSDECRLFSAQAPSGLASGTVITATFGGAVSGPTLGAMSFTGGATSSPLDVSNSASQTSTGTWSAGALASVTAGDLVCGVAWGDGNAMTDTPGTGYTAGWLVSNGTAGDTLAFIYQLNVAAGSYTPNGTWSVSNNAVDVSVGAAYKQAAGGGGGGATPALTVPQLMMMGVGS